MKQYCDLHTHSYYSDGSFSPKALIRYADCIGLSGLALTDHNTISGLSDFMDATFPSKVERIPGIEFTTDYLGTELHIVGLFLHPKYYGQVTEKTESYRLQKERSNYNLLDNLDKIGFQLDYQTVRALSADGNVNRAHIARAMLQNGYVTSINEAFSKYLSPGKGFYYPPQMPDPLETIAFIREIGSVAILAHPLLSMQECLLPTFLEQAVPRGLQAIESMYPKHSDIQTKYISDIAGNFGLLESGGSDFHGITKPNTQLGTGYGTLSVPSELLSRLKALIRA